MYPTVCRSEEWSQITVRRRGDDSNSCRAGTLGASASIGAGNGTAGSTAIDRVVNRYRQAWVPPARDAMPSRPAAAAPGRVPHRHILYQLGAWRRFNVEASGTEYELASALAMSLRATENVVSFAKLVLLSKTFAAAVRASLEATMPGDDWLIGHGAPNSSVAERFCTFAGACHACAGLVDAQWHRVTCAATGRECTPIICKDCRDTLIVEVYTATRPDGGVVAEPLNVLSARRAMDARILQETRVGLTHPGVYSLYVAPEPAGTTPMSATLQRQSVCVAFRDVVDRLARKDLVVNANRERKFGVIIADIRAKLDAIGAACELPQSYEELKTIADRTDGHWTLRLLKTDLNDTVLQDRFNEHATLQTHPAYHQAHCVGRMVFRTIRAREAREVGLEWVAKHHTHVLTYRDHEPHRHLLSALASPGGLRLRFIATGTYVRKVRREIVASLDLYQFELRLHTFSRRGLRVSCSLAVAERVLGVPKEAFMRSRDWLACTGGDGADLERLFIEHEPRNAENSALVLLLRGAAFKHGSHTAHSPRRYQTVHRPRDRSWHLQSVVTRRGL